LWRITWASLIAFAGGLVSPTPLLNGDVAFWGNTLILVVFVLMGTYLASLVARTDTFIAAVIGVGVMWGVPSALALIRTTQEKPFRSVLVALALTGMSLVFARILGRRWKQEVSR
jgi:hypothetical protein